MEQSCCWTDILVSLSQTEGIQSISAELLQSCSAVFGSLQVQLLLVYPIQPLRQSCNPYRQDKPSLKIPQTL